MQIVSIDQRIVQWFNSFETNGWNWGNLLLIILSLFLTVVLSFCIGLEREMKGRSAGLRTHLLVSVGSCIIMIVSIYGFPQMAEGFTRDPARLAAQVVTGVGFLGAGAIIHFGGGIKGLTTASTIWLVMALGLACGSMNFTLAIIGTIIVMIVLISFRKVERMITKNNPMVVILADSEMPVMTEVLATAKEYDCSVSDVFTQIIQDGAMEKLQVTFRLGVEQGMSLDIDGFIKSLKTKIRTLDIQILNHH